MKFMTASVLFCAGIASAMGVNLPFVADFTERESLDGWTQADSSYYQPLGKVEHDTDGLRMTANDQTPVFVRGTQMIAINPGDKIELTIQFKCERDTYVYFGLFEYRNSVWVKNDIDGFWVKPGMDRSTKVITVKPGKEINRGALVFGVAKGGMIIIRNFSAKLAGFDQTAASQSHLPSGLIMHLDGSRRSSMDLNNNEKLMHWRDLSGKGNDVMPLKSENAPAILCQGLNQLPMVRFDGKQELISTRPVSFPNGVSVFVIFRRDATQTGGENWQDSLSCNDSENGHNFHVPMGAGNSEERPRIVQFSSGGIFKAPLRIGSNAGIRGFLKGDIGEILVFQRNDLTAEEVDDVRGYLLNKWNFDEDDYVRFGPLPASPERISDLLPLSDQRNYGKWRKIEACSDEFNGDRLDREKWTDLVFYTLGPAPVRTLPDNVKIKDGMARIYTNYNPEMPAGRLTPRGPEYHSFSNGLLQSTFMFRYGYIETRAKVQASSFNSAFWMIGAGINKETGQEVVPEIDVFELAGKSFAHTYSYNMAIHCVQKKPEYKHYNYGAKWRSNFNFTDDFHVYGLEWTPTAIRYYIDGILVRDFKVKNNLWCLPMTVHFNSLPHFDWFGIPDVKDFPSVFHIDYFRLWKNPETDIPEDWNDKYKITHKTRTEGFSYDYYRKNGINIAAETAAETAFEEMSLSMVETAEATAKWDKKFGANTMFDNGATQFSFPAVAARKDNGEVQYAAPSNQWPRMEFLGSDLKLNDWTGYRYLAIEFDNPSAMVASCTLRVLMENGVNFQYPVLMKSGKGVVFWELPEPLSKGKIKSLELSVRGSDKPVEFKLLSLKIQK